MNIRTQNYYNFFLFIIGLSFSVWLFVINITGISYDFFPGDLGDARFNNYILEHSYQFMCSHLESFWDAPFIYPEKEIITYSDNLIGTSPFYAVFRLIGYDRETSFQNWFLLMTIFNYTSCFFLLKYMFKNTYVSVLGALVFACSIALQSQVGHAQTIPRFPIPLGILFGLLYIENLKPKYFFLTIFALTYQIYCGIYLGFLMFIPIVILLIISFIVKRKLYTKTIRDMKWLSSVLLSCILNLVLLLLILLPYKKRADSGGLYLYENIVSSVPTFKSFFFSNPGSFLWGKLEHIADDYPYFWDFKIFPGGVATLSILFCLILTVIAIIKKKKLNEYNHQYIIIFITGFITFLFFVRIDDISFYKILFNIPGFASMRALQRIINIELVFYSIATAFFLKYLFKSKNELRNFIVFSILILIVVIDNKIDPENAHRTKKQIAQDRIYTLVKKMEGLPKGSVISYEPDTMYSHPNDYQIDAMLASQSLQLKCLNGYTATSPNEYYWYWSKPNEESRKKWLDYKGVSSDKIIVIH